MIQNIYSLTKLTIIQTQNTQHISHNNVHKQNLHKRQKAYNNIFEVKF
jgi:hypothetical protein